MCVNNGDAVEKSKRDEDDGVNEKLCDIGSTSLD
jgi:hypothetical protein